MSAALVVAYRFGNIDAEIEKAWTSQGIYLPSGMDFKRIAHSILDNLCVKHKIDPDHDDLLQDIFSDLLGLTPKGRKWIASIKELQKKGDLRTQKSLHGWIIIAVYRRLIELIHVAESSGKRVVEVLEEDFEEDPGQLPIARDTLRKLYSRLSERNQKILDIVLENDVVGLLGDRTKGLAEIARALGVTKQTASYYITGRSYSSKSANPHGFIPELTKAVEYLKDPQIDALMKAVSRGFKAASLLTPTEGTLPVSARILRLSYSSP